MKAYRSQTRQELGMSPSEWKELVAFVDEIRPRLNEVRRETGIESPAPYFTNRDATDRPTEFNPGGWIGTYPGGLHVHSEKLDESEHRHIIERVAGWLEIWDVPTAAAVLPLQSAEALEPRSMLLGYSQALLTFTEEALAHRPPIDIGWKPETGPEPRGPIDVERTAQLRTNGSRQIAFNRLEFSLDHPLNLLLLRFHAELGAELSELAADSVVMTSTLTQHHRYHHQFIESEFPEELVKRSLSTDFTDPDVLDRARRQSPAHLTELVALWESYLQDQALNVAFEHQLNVGIKPIEKLYELWILTVLLDILTEIAGVESALPDDDLRRFDVGADLTLHYNAPLRTHSRILAPAFDTHPGRPDFALEADGEIMWIGDAKFSPASNIGLGSYQRLLSYAVDLMAANGAATASILYVGAADDSTTADTAEYTIEQMSLRPRHRDRQEALLETQLQRCLSGTN